jgi:ketosteroid isomerase-like protein
MKNTIVILWTLIALLSPARALSAQGPSPSSLIATEQEVRQFFDQYAERYTRMDLEGFLSLFSMKARQNQKDGLPEIKTIYSDLFNRSRSLQIYLEDTKIEIYQNGVEAKARYSVSQVLKEGGEKRAWRGDVRWVLAKEEGKLKILSIDYRYSMPPTPVAEGLRKPRQEPAVKAVLKPEPMPLPLANEEEVKQFFSGYIDQYQRKDVDGFLSFFSSRAVQNQKEGLEGIRSIYTKFFGQSRLLTFRLEGMKTEIYQNAVEVKARFKVDQILKGEGEEKVWTGAIRWVLAKEDGALKIVSLDYQNDKTPSKKEAAEGEKGSR